MNVSADRLRVHPANPHYFAYRGKPLWLSGHSRLWTLNGWMESVDEPNSGAVADPGTIRGPQTVTWRDEVSRMQTAGCHLVRMTPFWPDGWMHGRPMPWARNDDGRFDLRRWDERYWDEYRQFLGACADVDIVVQLEMWDRPGLSHWHASRWPAHPFNPEHNVNYDTNTLPGSGEAGRDVISGRQLFYATVDGGSELLLELQRHYMDRLIREAAPYPNIIYCIENEGCGGAAWERYWGEFVLERIPDALIAAMPLDAADNTWRDYFHPPFNCLEGGGTGLRYALLGNHLRHHAGWGGDDSRNRLDRLYLVRETLAKYRLYMEFTPAAARPVYVSNAFGEHQDGLWAMFCCGAAGLRYHRNIYTPEEEAYGWVANFNRFLNDAQPPFVEMAPAPQRLRGHALCLANERCAVVYLPGARGIRFAVWPGHEQVRVRMFDVLTGEWVDDEQLTGESQGAQPVRFVTLQPESDEGTAAWIEAT